MGRSAVSPFTLSIILPMSILLKFMAFGNIMPPDEIERLRNALPLSECQDDTDFDSLQSFTAAKTQIGDLMLDGSVFAGISPSYGLPMLLTDRSVSSSVTWHDARLYAERLNQHGHKDWRLPTLPELNHIRNFRNQGHIADTFNVAGFGFPACFWSSSEDDANKDCAWQQCLLTGLELNYFKDTPAGLRCVRT